MWRILVPLLDVWHRRWARPSPEARARTARLQPATVITGASAGIGLALARRFAKAGHCVVLTGRRPAELNAAADHVRETAITAVFTLPLDASATDALDKLTCFLKENGLYLDILINNAGMGLSGRFDEQDPAEVSALVALNVQALTRLMHGALPAMRARGAGGVLNVASLGGYCPGPYQALYYASKAYVISLTEAVATEMAGEGVRLAVLAPGPAETGFHARMGAENSLYRWLMPGMPPEQIAASAFRGFMLWRRVIVPGILPNLLRPFLRLLPHPLLTPLVALLLAPVGQGKKRP